MNVVFVFVVVFVLVVVVVVARFETDGSPAATQRLIKDLQAIADHDTKKFVRQLFFHCYFFLFF